MARFVGASFLVLACMVIPLAAQAAGDETADTKDCSAPYIAQCGCNQIMNPQTKTCESKANSNSYQCPCTQTDSGAVTSGMCVAQDKCLANKTNGQTPQQVTPAQQAQANNGNTAGGTPAETSGSSGGSSGGTSATVSGTSAVTAPSEPSTETSAQANTATQGTVAPSTSLLQNAFQWLTGQDTSPATPASSDESASANSQPSAEPSWLSGAQASLQPSGSFNEASESNSSGVSGSANEPVGGATFESNPSLTSTLSNPMGNVGGLTSVGNENSLGNSTPSELAVQDLQAIQSTIQNDVDSTGKSLGSWIDSSLYPPDAQSQPLTSQQMSAQALTDAAQAFGQDHGYSQAQIDTVGQGLAGVAAQESSLNAGILNSGQYQGLGQLNAAETAQAINTLTQLSQSPNLSPDQQAQVQGEVEAIQEMQANGVNPNSDPEAGAWLLAARQADIPDVNASPMDIAAQYATSPQNAAAIMEGAQLAPAMYANQTFNPNAPLTTSEVAALSSNKVDVSGGTVGSAIAAMQTGPIYANNFNSGVALAQNVSDSPSTAGSNFGVSTYASATPIGGVSSYPAFASADASMQSSYAAGGADSVGPNVTIGQIEVGTPDNNGTIPGTGGSGSFPQITSSGPSTGLSGGVSAESNPNPVTTEPIPTAGPSTPIGEVTTASLPPAIDWNAIAAGYEQNFAASAAENPSTAIVSADTYNFAYPPETTPTTQPESSPVAAVDTANPPTQTAAATPVTPSVEDTAAESAQQNAAAQQAAEEAATQQNQADQAAQLQAREAQAVAEGNNYVGSLQYALSPTSVADSGALTPQQVAQSGTPATPEQLFSGATALSQPQTGFTPSDAFVNSNSVLAGDLGGVSSLAAVPTGSVETGGGLPEAVASGANTTEAAPVAESTQLPSWANTVVGSLQSAETSVQNDYQALANEFAPTNAANTEVASQNPPATSVFTSGSSDNYANAQPFQTASDLPAVTPATEPADNNLGEITDNTANPFDSGTPAASQPNATPQSQVASDLQAMTTPPASEQLGRNYYELGDQAPELKTLQQDLNNLGYPVGSALTCSGSTCAGAPGQETDTFGPATYRAVEQFQAANGLAVDGQVGPATVAAINDQIAALPAANTAEPFAAGALPQGSYIDDQLQNGSAPAAENSEPAPTQEEQPTTGQTLSPEQQATLEAEVMTANLLPGAGSDIPADDQLTPPDQQQSGFIDMLGNPETPSGEAGIDWNQVGLSYDQAFAESAANNQASADAEAQTTAEAQVLTGNLLPGLTPTQDAYYSQLTGGFYGIDGLQTAQPAGDENTGPTVSNTISDYEQTTPPATTPTTQDTTGLTNENPYDCSGTCAQLQQQQQAANAVAAQQAAQQAAQAAQTDLTNKASVAKTGLAALSNCGISGCDTAAVSAGKNAAQQMYADALKAGDSASANQIASYLRVQNQLASVNQLYQQPGGSQYISTLMTLQAQAIQTGGRVLNSVCSKYGC